MSKDWDIWVIRAALASIAAFIVGGMTEQNWLILIAGALFLPMAIIGLAGFLYGLYRDFSRK